MEINGRSPWWIPTSSIIIPASVPVRSNYILKMPSVPQPPTPQDQSIILIFGCPPTPLHCLLSSSAFAPFFLLRACRYVSQENQTLKNKGWWVINHPSHLQAPLIPSFRLSVCSVVHPAYFSLAPAMSFLPRPLSVWRMGGAFHSFPPSCHIISMQICIAWFASQIASPFPPVSVSLLHFGLLNFLIQIGLFDLATSPHPVYPKRIHTNTHTQSTS